MTSTFQYHGYFSVGVKLLVGHQLNFFMFDDISKFLACDVWWGRGHGNLLANDSRRIKLFLALDVLLGGKRCLVGVLSLLLLSDTI